jgi:N-methylhydantoinase B/oxoprolinase/acetone carboxylase alpha subunit
VLEYSLIPDSGGAGRMRGGLGTRRRMRVEAGEVTCNALFDRTKPGFGAWGLVGGGIGSRAAVMVKKKGDTEFRTFSEVYGTPSPSKFTNCVLEEGDEVLLESPGGGGYGDPRERDPARLERDLFEGFVSESAAAELYGWKG